MAKTSVNGRAGRVSKTGVWPVGQGVPKAGGDLGVGVSWTPAVDEVGTTGHEVDEQRGGREEQDVVGNDPGDRVVRQAVQRSRPAGGTHQALSIGEGAARRPFALTGLCKVLAFDH